jgi:hypothetical protein
MFHRWGNRWRQFGYSEVALVDIPEKVTVVGAISAG